MKHDRGTVFMVQMAAVFLVLASALSFIVWTGVSDIKSQNPLMGAGAGFRVAIKTAYRHFQSSARSAGAAARSAFLSLGTSLSPVSRPTAGAAAEPRSAAAPWAGSGPAGPARPLPPPPSGHGGYGGFSALAAEEALLRAAQYPGPADHYGRGGGSYGGAKQPSYGDRDSGGSVGGTRGAAVPGPDGSGLNAAARAGADRASAPYRAPAGNRASGGGGPERQAAMRTAAASWRSSGASAPDGEDESLRSRLQGNFNAMLKPSAKSAMGADGGKAVPVPSSGPGAGGEAGRGSGGGGASSAGQGSPAPEPPPAAPGGKADQDAAAQESPASAGQAPQEKAAGEGDKEPKNFEELSEMRKLALFTQLNALEMAFLKEHGSDGGIVRSKINCSEVPESCRERKVSGQLLQVFSMFSGASLDAGFVYKDGRWKAAVLENPSGNR